jgi:hypothetical protein
MTQENPPAERRKRKRFKMLPEAVSFVRTSWPDCTTAGRIVDISIDGLALFHVGSRLPSKASLKLDIVLPGGICYLEELSGEIIFDCETESETGGYFSARRCGAQFRGLTHDQESHLRYVIQNYTTAGQEG